MPAPSTVDWRYDAGTVPWLRALRLFAAALVGGAVLLVYGVAALGLAVAFLTGSPGYRALIVLLVLVGGPLSLLHLLPLRDPEQRAGLLPFTPEKFRRNPPLGMRTRLALAVAGAVVLAVAWWLRPLASLALAAAGFLAGIVAVLATTRGRIDGDDLTLTFASAGAWEAPIDRLRDYRALPLGPLVLFRLRYDRAPGALSLPGWVLVPARERDAAAAVFDRAATLADEERTVPERPPNPTVRVVAGALGLGLLALGAWAAVFVGGIVGWYLLLLVGVFALLLLWIAVYEG